MANPTWPGSLGTPLFEGYATEGDEGVIRSQMDGCTKIRRRYTAVPERIVLSLHCDQAQMQVLEDFYSVTLKRVLPFDWREWRKPDATLVTYRFASRPKYVPTGPGFWRAELQLDLLTTFQGTYLLDVSPLTT